MEPSKESAKKNISDALTLGAVTLVGNLATFLFSYNYLDYFGVPVYLYEVNIGILLSVCTIGIFISIYTALLIDEIYIKSQSKEIKIFWRPETILLIVLLVIVFMYYDPNQYFAVFRTLIFGIAGLVYYYFAVRSLVKSEVPQDAHPGPLGRIRQIYGIFPFFCLFVCVIFLAFSYFFGHFYARNQENFLLMENASSSIVILSTWSGNLVGVEVNSIERTFERKVRLIAPSTYEHLGLRRTKVGPLSPLRSNYDPLNNFINALMCILSKDCAK